MPAEVNGTRLKKVDFEDFNFRVSYQVEQDFNVHSNFARNIISKWENSLKTLETFIPTIIKFFIPFNP